MNEHEVKGAVRHVKGRAETALGGVTGDLGRQAEGIVHQVAGGVQHVYGKAVEEAEDLAESGRRVARDARTVGRRYAREARSQAEELGDAGAAFARDTRAKTAGYAGRVARTADGNRLATVLGIAAAGFLVGWLARSSGERS